MPAPGSRISRRALVLGLVGLGATAGVGGAVCALGPDRVRARLGWQPPAWIPDAPEGQARLETVHSSARGHEVQLFTAVPHGYGDGAGLPTVVVLHGASATAADFREFGLARFLTQAVRDGAEPFVLAGADGGIQRWEPRDGDDPRAMVLDELPDWLSSRGFDADRRALWGWSMGGYGVLRIAETEPSFAAAIAAFSPAISVDDEVFVGADALAGTPLGIWCGTDDTFYPAARAFVDGLPTVPALVSFGPGGHTRAYWNANTLAAFTFLAQHLS